MAAGVSGGIGGAPAAVEGATAQVSAAAATMTTAAHDVGDHGDAVVARWTGSAASAAHERIRHLSQRTDVGAEVASELPKVLVDYAAELRAAQAEHARAVVEAQASRAALAGARAAITGAAAMAEPVERAAAMRLSGQSEAIAAEDVAASSHAVEAAVARERVANAVAAPAVRALTVRLSGMDPTMAGDHAPGSARAVQPAGGPPDEGRPLTWVERTADKAVDLAAGAADTAYLVPQAVGYGILRATGSDHEQAMGRLERDRQWLADRAGVDTGSAYHDALNLRDDWDDFRDGTEGGGWREAVGAGGELAWQGTAGLAAFALNVSPFESDRAAGEKIDDAHDWLEDEWGTQTDTGLYRGIVLAGALIPSSRARKSIDDVGEAIEGDLADAAKRGAGDDASIAADGLAPPTAPVSPGIQALGPVPVGDASHTWRQNPLLLDHTDRHGPDFGLTDPEEHAAAVNDFRRRAGEPGIEVKVQVKKDNTLIVRMYEPATDTFASYNGSGTTKTYFKPGASDPGSWGRQPGNVVS